MGFLCADPDVKPDADLPIEYAAHLSSWDNQMYQYLNQDEILPRKDFEFWQNNVSSGYEFINEVM